MHDTRTQIEERLDRFIAQVLPAALYRRTQRLEVGRWDVPGEPVPAAVGIAASYAETSVPHAWGAPWTTTWFRGRGVVPEQWLVDGRLPQDTRLEIVVDLGFYGERPGFQAEGAAYRADGTLIKGIAPRSAYVPWSAERPQIELFVEAAANPDVAGVYTYAPTPLGDRATAGTDPLYTLRQFDVALLDIPVWELAQDVWTLNGLMRELDPSLSRRWEILRALERMLDAVAPDDVAGTATAGRALLAPVLAAPASASAHRVIAVGHAHIDSAWLWPVRETIRKCARTFASAIALMDEHPEYRFACSSAQQLAWMQEHYPAIFERIREKVASGQFVPVGGMWVEPDMNMPGGEAMARQFLLGKRFFLDAFGVDCLEAWVPDTFGYSAAVPQIIDLAGVRWFMTQKISWNQVNEMPHTTFQWEGIDGTRVFTHFPSADTYISELSGAELAHAERNFKEKGSASTSLIPFGWGDGGGGPTREMLAAASRLASLEGSPAVRIDTPQRFFEVAEAEHADAPVWAGELYLELHRGSLTSQHETKQGNRRSEHLLREAELWAATAAVRNDTPYPYAQLDAAWKTVLLHQFHDILPGTSIAWVHREVEDANLAVAAVLEELIAASTRSLVGEGDTALRLNALPFTDAGVVALGIDEAAADEHPPCTLDADGGRFVLGNGLVRVIVDADGRVVSLRAGADGREAIAPGATGNELRLYRDTPNKWDAWDVDEHHRRVMTVLTELDEITADVQDDLVEIVVRRSFGASTISQRISVRRGDPAVTIHNDVDWREQDRMLKLAFALDVQADRYASETQFGHLHRPTHTNTSWDAARFEACAHRWLRVGEPGYGVAIANESSYGHGIERDIRPDGGITTTVGLSMLRGPRFPDPTCDQGRHTITYRVQPDASMRAGIELGYRTNLPIRTIRGARPVDPLFSVSARSVLVEAVKLAEDGSGDVIVRLYESEGARTAVTVSARFAAGTPRVIDLIERDLRPATDVIVDCTDVTATLRPFQVLSLRFPRSLTQRQDRDRSPDTVSGPNPPGSHS